MVQRIIHFEPLIKEVFIVIIVIYIEIDLPFPKPAKYWDTGVEFPSSKDRGICIFFRRAVYSHLVTTISCYSVVIVIVVVVVRLFSGISLFIAVIILFNGLKGICIFVLLGDEGFERFFSEGRDLVHIKSNEY